VSHFFVTPTVEPVPHGRRLRLVFARPEPWTEGFPRLCRPPTPAFDNPAQGATVKQTMDALQTALPGASKARLENIARTEATGA
jgi:hypothetical protein